MKRLIIPALLGATAISSPALAQDHSGHAGHDMPQPAAPATTPPVDHSKMDHSRMDEAETGEPPQEYVRSTPASSEGSGTARLPGREGPMRGLHIMSGNWMLMAHGTASLQYTDHKGQRGDSKTYVTTMAMLSATRDTSWGRVQLKSSLSLEPAMEAAGYPNLFATGETAGGLPLVDRQHPHDLFMELAARVDINAGSGTVFVYGGPVGEPALGPSAFMHRGSARYNPEPPITHHWFDSTHITYGVVTLGFAALKWQIEASAFRGAEPDEQRWNIETPKLDSWSVRATLTPTPNWAIQASYGEIKEPEAVHPGEDEHRFTASAHYANGRGLSAMAAFSAKKRVPGEALSAFLGEVNWDLDRHNSLFGRIENVANDELFPDHHDPLHDVKFRVTKFQAGYARRIPMGPFELALGGSLAAYAKPAALDAAYGDNPWGYTLFARISLGN
ncbi:MULTISPECIES: hypothetical protein [unclassified Novosphingobium]|uniref:hypothetical protein n=1 Tax=unclassified Novosphingobium TaxID=2644732 RepID=UPI0025ED49EA|nr:MULTISPECIES: hypothetical protein [unclassified Novosphingobium]HQV02803.1 hypothetical protein [Novosphingobium sp.]